MPKFLVTVEGREIRQYKMEEGNRVEAVAQASELYLKGVWGRPLGICDHFEAVEWWEEDVNTYTNDYGWEDDEGNQLERLLTVRVVYDS